MKIIANSADRLYQATLKQVAATGKVVAPRGDSTREVVGAHLVLTNPLRNIITIPERKLSYHFMLAEWLWITLGMNDTAMIVPYNTNIGNFSDDGQVLRGAYGPKFIEQLPYVKEVLIADPFSRQAVISIWRERPRASKDVPCTLMMQFLIRQQDDAEGLELEMIVYMRSNDVWWGLPYDLFTFTMIQQQLAWALGLRVGSYHHMVGSLHLYDRHAGNVENVINSPRTGIDGSMALYPVSEIPGEVRAMFMGLTLLQKHADTKEDLLAWLASAQNMPAPWGNIMNVLGHRFHHDHTQLSYPWSALIP